MPAGLRSLDPGPTKAGGGREPRASNSGLGGAAAAEAEACPGATLKGGWGGGGSMSTGMIGRGGGGSMSMGMIGRGGGGSVSMGMKGLRRGTWAGGGDESLMGGGVGA